jgi:hypothetical protein
VGDLAAKQVLRRLSRRRGLVFSNLMRSNFNHRGYKPVALPGNRLNITRSLRVIPQYLANSADSPVDAVVGI